MAGTKISKVAKDINVSIATVVEFLQKKGIQVDNNPNSRIDDDAYSLLIKEYKPDFELKRQADKKSSDRDKEKAKAAAPAKPEEVKLEAPSVAGPRIMGKIDQSPPADRDPGSGQSRRTGSREGRGTCSRACGEGGVSAPRRTGTPGENRGEGGGQESPGSR